MGRGGLRDTMPTIQIRKEGAATGAAAALVRDVPHAAAEFGKCWRRQQISIPNRMTRSQAILSPNDIYFCRRTSNLIGRDATRS